MLGFIMIDPLYLILTLPGMLLAMWAQGRVKSTFAWASRRRVASGASGAETAAHILRAYGLNHVGIERVQGFLGDHYDPGKKVLRLSPDVYDGRSLAAVGIAAHEAGHAIQDRDHYGPLKLRNGIVPLASVGGNFAIILFMAGMFLSFSGLMYAAIVLFSAVVLFQLINLPVEFDASARARRILTEQGIVASTEDAGVAKVLNAAAWTYVAATIGTIMTLLYFVLRSGLLGGRSD